MSLSFRNWLMKEVCEFGDALCISNFEIMILVQVKAKSLLGNLGDVVDYVELFGAEGSRILCRLSNLFFIT